MESTQGLAARNARPDAQQRISYHQAVLSIALLNGYQQSGIAGGLPWGASMPIPLRIGRGGLLLIWFTSRTNRFRSR